MIENTDLDDISHRKDCVDKPKPTSTISQNKSSHEGPHSHRIAHAQLFENRRPISQQCRNFLTAWCCKATRGLYQYAKHEPKKEVKQTPFTLQIQVLHQTIIRA